jgi:predicted SAM-dependent methyltransferase
MLKIEIGCGKKTRPGYKTCDVRDLPSVDYVCTADSLPFEDGTVDEIYSRHVVEHFSYKEFLKVLQEWNRALKPGGTVYIICPNLLWHLEQVLSGSHASFFDKTSGQNARYWGFGSLFGWQQDEHDIHKFGFYYELLRDILLVFGFDQVEDLTNSGQGLENQPWHLEVRATKVSDAPAHESTSLYHHFDVKH